jgi:peptidoglycan/LPS O-acetylase OafA/YrhL
VGLEPRPDVVALPSTSGRWAESDAPLSSRHVPALDGLRGVAILLVIIVHASLFVPQGIAAGRAYFSVAAVGVFGVDLFFALSGFLITGILLDARGAPRYYRNFYARRVLRIFPLYYGFLIVYGFVLPWLAPSYFASLPGNGRGVAYLLLYASNYGMSFDHAFASSVNLDLHVFWSLAVEEQFYLMWPLLVAILSRRGLLWVCAALLVFVPLLRVALASVGMSAHAINLMTPTRMEPLIGGALVAALVRGPKGPMARAAQARVVAWAAGVAFVSAHFLLFPAPASAVCYNTFIQSIGYSIISLLFSSLVLLAVSAPTGRLAACLNQPVLRAFGRYSYGMYVIHAAIVVHSQAWFSGLSCFRSLGGARLPMHMAYVLFVAVASWAIAMVSWHAFEKRFLSLKRYFPSLPPQTEKATSMRGGQAIAA